jgi:hypothetical protein
MGFEIIELEMEPELQDKLVESYVLLNFSPASIDAFYNSYDGASPEGQRIENQLYAAVLNETIINAIQNEIKILKQQKEGTNKLLEEKQNEE